MKKEYLIIGGAGLALILYYLYTHRSKTSAELADEATEANTSNLARLMSGNVAAVRDSDYDEEDLEYNNLVNEYKSKYRSKPDASWTISQLEQKIKEYDQIQAAIDTYYELEDLYDEGRVKKDEKELGKMSLAEINTLIKETSNANKRTEWNNIKAQIQTVVKAFIQTVENDGTAFSPQPYDTNTLQTLIDYPKSQKVYANQYFREQGGAKTGKNYGGSTEKKLSIYDAISTGTRRTYRKGASKASELKTAYEGISGYVNEYGELK